MCFQVWKICGFLKKGQILKTNYNYEPCTNVYEQYKYETPTEYPYSQG